MSAVTPRAVAIISEYNPFHTGHAYQLQKAREDSGADVVIAIMSEHAVQRGEIAIADGYVRAEAAVRCGADLVLGLPFPYSCAAAEFFASAGVYIATAIGAHALHFGSECGDIDRLRQVSGRLCEPDFTKCLNEAQKAEPTRGVMEHREMLYRTRYGEDLPCGSNDLLGIAYLSAIEKQQSTLQALTCRREGQAYGDGGATSDGQYPSAMALRRRWEQSGTDALRGYMPDRAYTTLQDAVACGRAPLFSDAWNQVAFLYYRLTDASLLEPLAELQGGLAHHITAAARQSACAKDFFTALSTRRYTASRLRRAMLFGLCGVNGADLRVPPAFVRLLAANGNGCAYLAAIRKQCTLPVVTKAADIPTTAAAQRLSALSDRLASLVTATMPSPRDSAYFHRCKPYIEKRMSTDLILF